MCCLALEGPVNVPFAITLNGQDFNMDFGLCHTSSNKTTVMWDNPNDPKNIVPAVIPYLEMQLRKTYRIMECPYVYYPHPISHTLVPAGGPIRGRTSVRVFGRGFQIFAEDVRCKFGSDTDSWVQGSDKPVGRIGRDDEILCLAPPHLVLTVGGRDVACTYACIQFPDDADRCNRTSCSFNTSLRIYALQQAVAEIVSVKNIYGDNDVFPSDVAIEFFRQPRLPKLASLQPSIDVGFCVHCIRGSVSANNVEDSLRIIKAVRNGYMLDLLRNRYGFTGIEFIELNGDPVQVAVTLNGQDYTYQTNDIFSYFLSPTIFAITPAGGPLIRYAIADLDHRRPTAVEISGTGFFNYDEAPKCKFGEEVVDAVAFGDRLMKCETPWPRISFSDDCIECVLDVWLEVSLNGQDFSRDSQINFRYYLQPEFSTFSPMGGPVDGGTPVTFRGAGFNRFNDGSLRILWGKHRVFAEETIGGSVLDDDFDPIPEEVEPLPSEYGTQKGVKKSVIAYTYEDSHDIIQEAYRFDQKQWDYGSAVISNSQCSGMDLPAARSKIDIGFLPGDTEVTRLPIESRSLYLSGKSKGILSGRYIISKPLEISRGLLMSLWMKHGNATSPLACERPDARDELSIFMLEEEGNLRVHSNCTDSCTSPVEMQFHVCYGNMVSNLSVPTGYEINQTRLYEETGKVTRYIEYIVPLCVQTVEVKANGTDQTDLPLLDMTDVEWLQITVDMDNLPGRVQSASKRRIMIPLRAFTGPKINHETGFGKEYHFQECSCQKVFDCPAPPCKDFCTCFFVNDTSCVLKEIDQTRYKTTEAKVRNLECRLPNARTRNPMVVELKLEYVPAYTPPEWPDIGQWKRLSVFGHQSYPGYTHLSRKIYQNERGRRFGKNVNELVDSQATEAMVRCPRNKKCYNRRARIMVKQPMHGQGDFDSWALDDFKVDTNGGIISDTEIVASSPPADLALPLTPAQKLAWKKAGKLTNRYVRGIMINIALNNQTYEKAGKKNFCLKAGDYKPDPEDPTNEYKNIRCDKPYFNWDEPDWPFKTSVAPKYVNWAEGKPQPDWGKSNRLFRSSTSEQFLYYQHPKIKQVLPSGGPTGGDTPVTVQGLGFSAFSDPLRTPKCKFGSLVSPAQVMDDDSIVCSTPETLFAGYVDLTISLNEVDFTSPIMGVGYSIPFLFYEQPVVMGVMPFTGPSRGDTAIDIIGVGFFQLPTPPACRFIGINDPTVVADSPGEYVNDTLIRCRSPSIANLCTRSTHCDEGIGSRDPGWRDCPRWETCPFTNQCATCGCPKSPLCQSYERRPTIPEADDGVKVSRRVSSEEPVFDMQIQVSLNGICCVREDNGILSSPCRPCVDIAVRCGCVGDFTQAQYNQDAIYDNTFTFYREVEFMQESTSLETKIFLNSQWDGPNTNSKPILIFGQYFRNVSIAACALELTCHDDEECSNPPEASLETMFDSNYFMRPSYVLCKPPTFPGQKNTKYGKFDVSYSVNGQNPSKWSRSCDSNVCRMLRYHTPEHPESIQQKTVSSTVVSVAFVIYIYLYRKRMNEKNAKYVADTGGEWEKPSVREAMRHQQEHQFRKYGSQYYPIWTTGAQELGQLGIGMGLYFQYLNYMVSVFGVMFVLAIPSMMFNGFGMAYAATTGVSFSIQGSIGNIGQGFSLEFPTLPFPAYNFLNTGWMWGIPVKDLSVVLALIDISICSVFVYATWSLRLVQEKVIEALDEDTITAADYTVLVEGIPTDATDPDELRAFFSKYGEVADVAIGLNNGKLIHLFQKRGVQEIAIEEQIAKLKLYKLQALQKQLKSMRKKQRKIDEKIIQLRSKSDFKAVCAFVTFNEDKGQSECVEAYESNIFMRLRGKAKATKRFRAKYSLHVSAAPEPSNVLWENLQHRGVDTALRSYASNFIILVLLFSSLVIGLLVQTVQNQLQGATGSYLCRVGPQTDDPDAQQQIEWSQYTGPDTSIYRAYLKCYCDPSEGNMNDVEYDFCAPYRDNEMLILIMTVVALGVVAGVNASLEAILKVLSEWRKPHTLSALETMQATSVYTAQYVNTGLLILVYNMKLDGIELQLFQALNQLMTEYLGGASFLSGQYPDTNSAWFSSVGAKIVNQCISQSAVPNFVQLGKSVPAEIIKQNVLKNRMLTQKKLNKLFEGPEYPLWKRYANMLNIVFVVMTYSSGIPVLYVFGIVYYFLAYWCDKISILRGCARPAQYDEKLAMATTNLMSYMMLVHLLFGTWFYGYIDSNFIQDSPQFLPKVWGQQLLRILGLIFSTEKLLLERVSKMPSFVFFFFMVLWVVFEILMRYVLVSMFISPCLPGIMLER